MDGRGGGNGFCYGVAFVVVAQIIGVANQVGACLVGSLVETELLVVSEVHVNVGVHPIATVVGLDCDCIARVNGEGLVGQVLVCLLRAIELDGLDFVIARLQRDAVEHATAVVLIGFLVEIDGVFLGLFGLEGLVDGEGESERWIVARTIAYTEVLGHNVKQRVPDDFLVYGEGISASRCDGVG